jgi:hypothetical protein
MQSGDGSKQYFNLGGLVGEKMTSFIVSLLEYVGGYG